MAYLPKDTTDNLNQELLDYIKAATEHGLPSSEIKHNLLNAGWESRVVEDNFSFFVASKVGKKPPGKYSEDALYSKAMTGQPLSTASAEEQRQAQNFTDQPSGKKKHHWVLWTFLLLVLLALGGAGYYVYTYGYYTPSQLWNKFTQSGSSDIYSTKFTLNYNDDAQASDRTNQLLGLHLNNLNLKFNGSYYINSADPKNPESSAQVQYTFGSGTTNVSTGFEYRLKGQVMYLNIGSNPFLDLLTQSLTQSSGQSKKLEWLKLDFEALQKSADAKDPTQADIETWTRLNKIFTPEFKTQLEKLWQDTTLIKTTKVLGHEKLNNVQTLHFQNELDKKALENLFNAYVDKLSDAYNKTSPAELSASSSTDASLASPFEKIKPSDVALAHKLVNGIIDKIQISKFETWIGVKDFRLHKVIITSNAPSLLTAINEAAGPDSSAASNPTTPNARDSKRLADMRQMVSALELYYNDNSGYPEGKDGAPLDLTPTYIGKIPQTQTPADGKCSDYYNTYWYTPKGQKTVVNGKTVYQDYEYSFCLGFESGGYKAGNAKFTPAGITDGLACNDTQEHCKSSSPDAQLSEDQLAEKQMDSFLSQLNFSAQFDLQSEYTDYGQIRAVDEPKEFYDLTQLLAESKIRSRDSMRLYDIRQLASSLELYFNDKSSYPKTLTDLGPNYIYQLPTAPKPADGQCSDSDNTYTYQQLQNGQSYRLDFCLGLDSGGYGAGRLNLSPTGIHPSN